MWFSIILIILEFKIKKVFPKKSSSITQHIQFEISIENKILVIDLEPNLKLLTENLQIENLSVQENLRKSQFKHDAYKCFYTGKIQNYSDSSVALSICNGLVSI
jgi:hypothetical protein